MVKNKLSFELLKHLQAVAFIYRYVWSLSMMAQSVEKPTGTQGNLKDVLFLVFHFSQREFPHRTASTWHA